MAQAPQSRTGARNSVIIISTKGPASAFDVNDDDDDKYSVSEMSTAGTSKGGKERRESVTATFSKAHNKPHQGLERMKSVVADVSANDTESSSTDASKSEVGESTPVHDLRLGSAEEEQQEEDGQSKSDKDEDSIFGNDVDESDGLGQPSSFALFAQTAFQLRTTHVYSCSALQGALLHKQEKSDILASLASWVMILRVMGDLPESSGTFLSVIGEEPSIIAKVKVAYKKKYTRKDIEDAQRKYSEFFKDPVSAETSEIPFLLGGKETMLEKIQFICALGIYRPDMRDELYCQLCKQLTNNPSRNSTVRGWVLMELFAGCFCPSEKFAPCFRSFLKEGPTEFAHKVERLSRRTCIAGTRGFPPSWLEFQAAKNAKPILLPITFMSGQRILVEADAATTVRELSNSLAEILDFKNNNGYSIYVCLHQKISCMGHGLHRIMDAVSECEQHTKQMGLRESSSLWRLYYRKEYFSPWHNPREDPSATNIVYQQIMRGIGLGEYQCKKEEVLVALAAQRYYLEYSDIVDKTKLESMCKAWFPAEWKEDKGVPYLIGKVEAEIKKTFTGKKPVSADIKADIVTFAMDKWALMFSRYYDAMKVSGPGITAEKIVVGINSKGLYILDNGDSVRTQLPYHEIAKIIRSRHSVTVVTVKDEEYSITSGHSDDFGHLLGTFLQGLRMRSRYAIINQDITQEAFAGLNLAKGDLIVMDKLFQEYCKSDLIHGTCQRTGKPCDIPRDLVFIPHLVQEPSAEIMGMFTVQLKKDNTCLMEVTEEKAHTLQQYSRYHFRMSAESAVTKIFNKASLKRGKAKSETVWQFSKDPIKKPLLRKSLNREDARNLSCRVFTAVQQFMGDAPLKENMTDIELVNRWIVEPASRSRYLRDEVFCQVIKQLTNNDNKSSEERGWLLLMMLATTAIPGDSLSEEVMKFIESSRHPTARICQQRMEASKKRGCRLWPPHPVEHDMISKNQSTVRVKVFIPDNTSQAIEVSSMTRISDIKREVCTRLRLKTWEEYSLFMSFQESLHSLFLGDYYFDSLSHAEIYWMSSRSNSRRLSGPVSPLLVMLKKIWVNIEPGTDSVADVCFHFPQELPNFLRGYHKCADETTAYLAALVYRAKYGNDKKPLTEKFSDISQGIAPKQALRSQSSEFWNKSISKYYEESKSMTQEQAKASFLKTVSQWETYGSVFFEVKQRTVKEFPKQVLVAINMSGLHLIDAASKKKLKSFEFSSIPNWAYDDDSITLVIMEGNSTTKLLLETNVGHNMDDILMAYISWVMNTQMRRKHGFAGSPAGESVC